MTEASAHLEDIRAVDIARREVVDHAAGQRIEAFLPVTPQSPTSLFGVEQASI